MKLTMRAFAVLLLLAAGLVPAQAAAELRFALGAEPKTLDPLLVSDEPSEIVRYLTSGVLIRLNRRTQRLEPELAHSWKITEGGRRIGLQLRPGVSFSDGTPFTAEDVVYTFRRLMDPALNSPAADALRSGGGGVTARADGPHAVTLVFSAPVVALERILDGVSILSARSPRKTAAVLGPFQIAEHKAGAYLLLARNPHYWKRDAGGARLPYLDSIRLEFQRNRDFELLRFRRGEFHLINGLDAELFERLRGEMPGAVRDLGVSLDSEQMWFNQVPSAPIPQHKKAWFSSQIFRRAVSESINRADIARLAFRGHAAPAAGPVSPANKFWCNTALKPPPFQPQAALAKLAREGFTFNNGVLRDRNGHAVEFSLITNAGNKTRERTAALIQQDLAAIGIRLNVVTLDFPSLIERISRTFNYEACLLGLVHTDLDPSAEMNVWLSSASNHQWNPNQKAPATPWEAEIDRLMKAQAAELDPAKRKRAFDRVQEIVAEQLPFIYLVTKNSMVAVSPQLRNVEPVVLRPQVLWNADRLALGGQTQLAAR